MKSYEYKFNAAYAVQKTAKWIQDYFVKNGRSSKAVIGISGGKDSSVTAKLLVYALGAKNVIAVKIPQHVQSDIEFANRAIKAAGIPEENVIEVNIGPACDALYRALPPGMGEMPQVSSNTPARMRMATLYAIAAAVGGRVVNTCNFSEDYVGYSTKFGDSAGDFAPLANYTVSEVLAMGESLGIPNDLLYKAPSDGLCGKTDEDNLGFTYRTLDGYLRQDFYPNQDILVNIETRHERNLHKQRPMPSCPAYGVEGASMKHGDNNYFEF